MKEVRRVRLDIEGIVQGVGFRPFVFRLADRHGMAGWVRNTPSGVTVEAEGSAHLVALFQEELRQEAPPLAVISAVRRTEIPPLGEAGFSILPSSGGENDIQVAPDGDVCADCLAELFDPADRRYRYPFITCTNCGPRYSIITGIPYDRPLTTMAGFAMCPACRAEYDDPRSRRFHAQPNACPACGPRLSLLDVTGLLVTGDPLERASELLREGRIVAVKGTGGYHLAADATNEEAVAELRRRKMRDEKPFALMVAGLGGAARIAEVDEVAARLLAGPERPIVLLRKQEGHPIAPSVAPANDWFGVMLPSTPLQHLLVRDRFPALVMTSGNVSDEPIAYRDEEALSRLAGIADFFLVHDRPIRTRLDDSVLRAFRGNPLFLRRSRGYVPRGVLLPAPQQNVLAVGAELKSAVCLTRGGRAFLGQHVGDLRNAATLDSFAEMVAHLESLLEIAPACVAHDLHPDYLSTLFAAGIEGLPKVPVQHHHAHLASCMAENGMEGDTIGVIFDGSGIGLDGTVWGGEFLLGDYRHFRRVGHFRPVPMPGGDAAVREPYRMAIAFLHDLYGPDLFALRLPSLSRVPEGDRGLFLRMLARGINTPLTSSCGRLFDAVAALLDVRSRVSYEGQAAIELEGLAERGSSAQPYPYEISEEERFVVDFRPMIRELVMAVQAGSAPPEMARRFHATVAAAAAEVCRRIRAATGVNRVALSGGVFQNRLLTEDVAAHLVADRFELCTHRLVPPNDGGIALGQAVVAGRTVG